MVDQSAAAAVPAHEHIPGADRRGFLLKDVRRLVATAKMLPGMQSFPEGELVGKD